MRREGEVRENFVPTFEKTGSPHVPPTIHPSHPIVIPHGTGPGSLSLPRRPPVRPQSIVNLAPKPRVLYGYAQERGSPSPPPRHGCCHPRGHGCRFRARAGARQRAWDGAKDGGAEESGIIIPEAVVVGSHLAPETLTFETTPTGGDVLLAGWGSRPWLGRVAEAQKHRRSREIHYRRGCIYYSGARWIPVAKPIGVSHLRWYTPTCSRSSTSLLVCILPSTQ